MSAHVDIWEFLSRRAVLDYYPIVRNSVILGTLADTCGTVRVLWARVFNFPLLGIPMSS